MERLGVKTEARVFRKLNNATLIFTDTFKERY